MVANCRNPCTPTSSLAVEIAEAERRLRHRQLLVQVRVDRLGQTLGQRMTAPVTLIWAGATGFLIGEVSHCQTPDPEATDPPKASGPTFFETVLDLIRFATWMHALMPVAPEIPREPTACTGPAKETTGAETQTVE